MSKEFTQATLDQLLAENTVKELRKEYPKVISAHDEKSEYVHHLEQYSLKMRAAMFKLMYKSMMHIEGMVNELGFDL